MPTITRAELLELHRAAVERLAACRAAQERTAALDKHRALGAAIDLLDGLCARLWAEIRMFEPCTAIGIERPAVTFLRAAGRGWSVNGRPVRAGRSTACISLAWHSIAFAEGAPIEMFAASPRSAANMLNRAREWAKRNAPELVAPFASLRIRGDRAVFEPSPRCAAVRVTSA